MCGCDGGAESCLAVSTDPVCMCAVAYCSRRSICPCCRGSLFPSNHPHLLPPLPLPSPASASSPLPLLSTRLSSSSPLHSSLSSSSPLLSSPLLSSPFLSAFYPCCCCCCCCCCCSMLYKAKGNVGQSRAGEKRAAVLALLSRPVSVREL